MYYELWYLAEEALYFIAALLMAWFGMNMAQNIQEPIDWDLMMPSFAVVETAEGAMRITATTTWEEVFFNVCETAKLVEPEAVEKMKELLKEAVDEDLDVDGIYLSYEQMEAKGILRFKACKPPNSPDLYNFFHKKGGMAITICANGAIWIYTAPVTMHTGLTLPVSVTYVAGYPVFPDYAVYDQFPNTPYYIDIGQEFSTRPVDSSAAKNALKSLNVTMDMLEGYTGHHSAWDSRRYIFVDTPTHMYFTHTGGCSLYGD